ncbi:MAG: zinc ribbon domain-containing protein [Phycisphaerae bacterium]|nr:zinc ribbon domain-containing protein [Phycisphaerae bacterium]
MPTYEYRCSNCDHELEAFQSITAKSLKKCPECGKLKLQRLISSGAGLIFKGSGFYETDYRSESYKKGGESEKPKSDSVKTDSKKKPKAETKKADAKPAAKKKTESK